MMARVSKRGEHQKRVIEALTRKFGPISQIGIYKLTKFRRTTISELTRQLLSEDRIVVVGRSNNPVGRKQVLLQLNERHGFVVGVEFDDEKIVAGVMDLHPTILHQVSEPTDLNHGKEGLLAQLQKCTKRVIHESGVSPNAVIGIGIADPGLVDSRRGVTVLSSTIDFWHDVELKQIFEQEFDIQTVVESKTRAKTLAEQMLGADKPLENLIYLDYGAGIGAGIVVDGKLLYGHSCGVGEIGHTRINDDGPACKCGSIGCLEAIAGTAAVERKVRKALAEGAISQVTALSENSTNVTTQMVLQSASNGDKLCGNILSELARDLGVALANTVNLFNPSDIVLDRSLKSGGKLLIDQISHVIRGHALSSFTDSMVLRFSELDEMSGILGLGLVVLEKHFEIQAAHRISPEIESA